MNRLALTLIIGILGCAAAMADADEFLLANGGRITGRLVNMEQNPRQSYQVQTADGMLLELAAAQVRKFVPTSDARRQYEALLPRMPENAEGHWKMAQWCLAQGLDDEREHHLNEVIRLDPDHRDARLALGYTSLDGRWVLTDEWNKSQGYIYHQGKWMTPQEAESIAQAEKIEELQKSWKPKLKRWRSNMNHRRNPQVVRDAVAQIRAVKDPLAGAALADMYEDEEIPAVRKMWVEVLGVNASAAAVDAVVKAAVEDEDRDVREAARDALEESKDRRAIGALLAELKSKDNKRVNRAAAALGRIADPETFVPLIDALVTEHKFVITQGPPGSTSATFGSGGTGFSAGNKTKVVTRKVQNSEALTALVKIVQDQHDRFQNFQYDQEAWKSWYAELHTPEEVSLRRDP